MPDQDGQQTRILTVDRDSSPVGARSFSVVGHRIPMIDAREKATGQLVFASDFRLPRMLAGKSVRGPYPHARIVNIDASRARRVAGVRAIITSQDTSPIKYGSIFADRNILPAAKTRFAGEEVAAVAAETEEAAAEAVSLIHVEYDELPAVYDPQDAILAGAPLVHEDVPGNMAKVGRIDIGDVDRAFAESDFIVDGTFSTGYVHQGYLEPTSAVAAFDASGRLTLWLGNQGPSGARALYSQALGLDEDMVRVIQLPMGGGFGGKFECNMHLICAELARKTGRPVRMLNTREDEHVSGGPRVPMRIYMKIGAARDGRLTAKYAGITADNGAYSNSASAILLNAAVKASNLYRFRNLRADIRLVYTNKVPSGAFRGYGGPQATFAQESLIDTLAADLGMDPIDLRLKNATRTGDVTAHGWVINTGGLPECLEQARETSNWVPKRAGKKPGVGIGVACGVHVSGSRVPGFEGSSAIIRLTDQGKATVITGEIDTGTGARTVLAQIAAEELGLPIEDVTTTTADTDTSPYCLGAWATRTTTLGGLAVKNAAADIRRQLLGIAGKMLKRDPKTLSVRDGRLTDLSGECIGLSVKDVSAEAVSTRGGQPIIGQGHFDPSTTVLPDPVNHSGNISVAYPFAAQVAEVEVDAETGQVTLTGLVSAHDVGRVINPLTAEGQVEGGAVQGAGFALYEELVIANGRVLNHDFTDYHMPTAADVPSVKSLLIETDDPTGPYGAKGLGEVPLVPAAAAIANAIYDAVGVRADSLPMTPEKIAQAMAQAQKSK